MSYTDKLVFGKNETERIIGIEVQDPNVILFIQEKDGSIKEAVLPNKYWLLSNRPIQKDWLKLEGNLHYQYGKQFSDRKEFTKWRGILGKQNDLYSIWNPQEAAMTKDGITMFKGMTPPEVSLMSIDIETTSLDPNVPTAKLLLVSTTFRDHTGNTIKKLFSYDEYESDLEFINDLNTHVQNMNPALVIGHNIISFDMPYLETIARKAGTSLSWGRDKSDITFSNRESNFRLDGTRDLHYKEASIFGREIVDTYFLSIKYDVLRSMESYGLKSLIAQLGLETPGRTFYDAGQIRFKYNDPEEYAKIKEYCKDDADDSIKLWDLMGPLFFYTTQMVPKPFGRVLLSASGSQINGMMVRSYLQDKHSIPKTTPVHKFEGALSWGKPGIYKNILKLDVNSMYPSIILAYEVYDSDKDPKAHLLQFVKVFRKNRLEYKRLAAETGLKSYQDMDTAAKGILNSFYGFYGATGLNFNSAECAEFITEKGRQILKKAITWATSKEFEEIAPEYFETDETQNNEEE